MVAWALKVKERCINKTSHAFLYTESNGGTFVFHEGIDKWNEIANSDIWIRGYMSYPSFYGLLVFGVQFLVTVDTDEVLSVETLSFERELGANRLGAVTH